MGYKHLSDEMLEEYTKGMVQPYIAIALVPAIALELQRARKELAVYKNGAVPYTKKE